MVARTQAQKFVLLREQFESLALLLRAKHGFPDERKERQTLGQYQTLENVAYDLRQINAGMKPAEFQPIIERVLDRLGEQKANGMVHAIRDRRKYGINQLGEWMAEGAIDQIDAIVEQLLARLSPKWHASSSKMHGRFFHLYYCLDTTLSSVVRKQCWFNFEREQRYQEVAILQIDQSEHQLEALSHLTGRLDWCKKRQAMWLCKAYSSPVVDQVVAKQSEELVFRPRRQGDVFVSVLSGAAWMIEDTGFNLLVPPSQTQVEHG